HISFFFKALKAGETKLVIDKIANKITKNFLDYKITVKKNKKQLAAAASRRRQIKKEAQKERAGYELIRKLYQDEQYETALKHIRQYKKNNPTGPYLTPNTMIEAAILTNRGQPEKAVSLLSNLLTAAGKKKNPAGRSKTMFSLAKIYLQAGDTNRGLDILYRLEADYHGTPLYSKALLKLADTLYAGQKYRQAQKYYFAFYKLYTDKENNFETEGFDRAVWRIARIYEIAADITDMSRAYQWYTLLPDICPFSSYVEQARRKAEYIDRHFLNIR
ncbi:MAG TPA: hypothetical protein VKS21_10455, partial [Spirochaetota bacterium]|nr:hypothetical protein [Spirochaetota bacterium]